MIYRKGYMLEQLVSSSKSASRKNCTKPAQGLRWEKKCRESALQHIILKDNFPQYPVFSFVFIEVSIELL